MPVVASLGFRLVRQQSATRTLQTDPLYVVCTFDANAGGRLSAFPRHCLTPENLMARKKLFPHWFNPLTNGPSKPTPPSELLDGQFEP